MAEHNILGREGEDAACNYLQNKGYTILERNWRWRNLELDIIAISQQMLVVIEVKTRRNNNYGTPETAVDNAKIRRIIQATDIYLKKNAIDLPVRFDIMSVTGITPPFHIRHIKEAFYPPIW